MPLPKPPPRQADESFGLFALEEILCTSLFLRFIIPDHTSSFEGHNHSHKEARRVLRSVSKLRKDSRQLVYY